MKVVLLAHTPTPEQTVAAAARLCYSDTDVAALRESISQERAEQFVEMLAGFGHESPVEHVTFTFGIEGVSRSFLAQITRHRIASFSVQSQRYVRQDHFVFITPPAIAADPALKQAYENAMQQSIDSYNHLADALAAKYVPEFLAQGCTEKAAHTKAEKKAIEDELAGGGTPQKMEELYTLYEEVGKKLEEAMEIWTIEQERLDKLVS